MRAGVSTALVTLSCLIASCASGQQPCPEEPDAPLVAAPEPPPTPEPLEADPLAKYSIPPRPDWTDKYAGSDPGDARFFNVTALMSELGLDRAAAVEVQNHYRDLSREAPEGDRQAQFDTAVSRAREGEFESPRATERLRDADFIVVFDLDETLYDQYIEHGEDCHDIAYGEGEERKYIKLTPGWEQAIDRIHELGGAVVVFSANRDVTNYANLAHWKKDDVPLYEHEKIAGFLTNSHLVMQEKSEGDPVVEPSKDLRIFDESLKKVIIVDDNPTRIFQFRNLRVFKKFDADRYCSTKDPRVKQAYDRALPIVVAEIEDSARYAKKKKVDFVTAYAPFTSLGQVAVNLLMGQGMSRAQAIAVLRQNPELIDDDY